MEFKNDASSIILKSYRIKTCFETNENLKGDVSSSSSATKQSSFVLEDVAGRRESEMRRDVQLGSISSTFYGQLLRQ